MRKLLIVTAALSLSFDVATAAYAAAKKDDAKPAAAYTLDANGKCKDGNKFTAQKNCDSLKAAAKPAAAPAATAAAKPAPAATPTAAAPAAKPAKASKTSSASKSSATIAPPPANAPAGSTALCNDGSFSMNKTHQGSCSRHGGVKNFFK
jgi:hypothetical protein